MTPKTDPNEDPEISGLDNAALKYWDGVQKAIGIEVEKLKEKVEQDSKQILASAQEEAKRVVEQAKQEAGLESKRIISEATEVAKNIVSQTRKEVRLESEQIINKSKEDAEQAAKKYREEAYDEALEASSRVIGSINEKYSRIITEIIERSLLQMKDDFIKVSLESKKDLENSTTRILTQKLEKVKEIAGDTKALKNNKSKSSYSIDPEPETESQPSTEPNNKNRDAILHQATKDATDSITSICEETDSGIHPVTDKIENDDTRLFSGRLKIEIVCPPHKEPYWSMQ
ncbi:MAG: ATP synthase F0 subunit B, partial [Dehalococcoidales bacterium]|nr:ATP synthase F0 subunit B [Dehalococcoidales bacterium]